MKQYIFYAKDGTICSTLKMSGEPKFPEEAVFIEVSSEIDPFGKRVNLETLSLENIPQEDAS